jgi:hypothetical protein
MNKLPETFINEDKTYTQVKRNDIAAIYSVVYTDTQTLVGFEVFKIRVIDGNETYPVNRDFVNGWAKSPAMLEKAETWLDRYTTGEAITPVTDNDGNIIVDNGPSLDDIDNMPDVNADPLASPVRIDVVANEEVSIEEPKIEAPMENFNLSGDTGIADMTGEVSAVNVMVAVADPITVTPVAPVVVAKPAKVKPVSATVNKNVAAFIIPTGEFTKVSAAATNNMSEPNTYLVIQALIASGKVKSPVFRKVTLGKGRPTAFYTAV